MSKTNCFEHEPANDQTATVSVQSYREAAKRLWAGDDEVSFDIEPEVSTADEGAWVACWVWIAKEGVKP